MRFFLRYLVPATYFRASRLNRVPLIAYNALIEWIPAIGLSLYFNSFNLTVLATVALSYLAFISIYEIGYLTNDRLSELFEADPRGRRSTSDVTRSALAGLIVVRLIAFGLCTYVLHTWTNPIWLAFHGTLAASFLLHNIVDRDLRLPTFFSLSTYRFFAPILLSVQPGMLMMLLPIVMLNNSLYRLTVYADNKKITQRQSIVSKFGFYLACLPLGLFFSVLFNSLVPIAVTLYFLLVWLLYLSISRVTGTDFRG